jgi:serine/threonine protein kinase
VHRDLKPSNLFLTRRLDGAPLIKLLDFGIAKAPDAQGWTEGALTVTHSTLGSPMYMSPEQLHDTSSVDLRTDVWALGVILYELVTAHHPFGGGSEAAVGALIAAGRPPSLDRYFEQAPAGLERAIVRCLEKDPRARFASVGELADALRPFTSDRSRASLDRVVSFAAVTGAGATVLAQNPSQDGQRLPTDNFRRQHDELARLGTELLQQLAEPPEQIAANASELRRSMARFAGKLSVHASMENDALYPRLLEHGDPHIRATARALFDEVKGIYSSFGAFTKRWPSTDSIVADPSAYARECQRVLKTLWARMVRENDELYPLADRVG